MKLEIIEIYFNKNINLDWFGDWFLKNTKEIRNSDKYFCHYCEGVGDLGLDNSFVRCGFINPTKKFLGKFTDRLTDLKNFEEMREWEEKPKDINYDMELPKFLAFETFANMKEHHDRFKKYYKDSNDISWISFLHHLFNLNYYDYNKEIHIADIYRAQMSHNFRKEANKK